MRDRIFIEEDGKLSGPFTERKVQEWYRKGCFTEKVVQFCFMSEEVTPASSTEKFSMAELQSHNGIGCPFKWVDRSKKMKEEEEGREKKQRMERIQKELSELRAKCEAIDELEKRIEKVKKVIEALPSDVADVGSWSGPEKPNVVDEGVVLWSAKAATAALSAAVAAEMKPARVETTAAENYISAREQRRNNPDRIIPQRIAVLIKFYLRIFKNFEKGTVPKEIYCGEFEQLERHFLGLKREDKQELFEEMEFLIEDCSENALVCSFCVLSTFGARQCFMHVASEDHKSKIFARSRTHYPRVNSLLEKIAGRSRVQTLFKQEAEQEKSLRKKWASMSLDDPKLRPTKKFIISFCKKRSLAETEEGSLVLIKELEKHIGTAKTRCFACKLIFADAAEYFEHVFTYSHVRKGPFDMITGLINFDRQKREINRRRNPWPE